MSLERVIIYLEAYAYDVCAWHRQVITRLVANEAISAGDENSSFLELPRAVIYIYMCVCVCVCVPVRNSCVLPLKDTRTGREIRKKESSIVSRAQGAACTW